jgi:hypothetical protein
MIRQSNVKDLMLRLRATDGDIGRCKDFLFDQEHWNIRYLVADTGKWIPGRKVLVSQVFLGEPDWSSRCFAVKLTKEQVEHSPSRDLDASVSRQYEIKYHNHYGLPHYWSELGVRGGVAYHDLPDAEKKVEFDTAELRFGDDHLSSAHEMTGNRIGASDGKIKQSPRRRDLHFDTTRCQGWASTELSRSQAVVSYRKLYWGLFSSLSSATSGCSLC